MSDGNQHKLTKTLTIRTFTKICSIDAILVCVCYLPDHSSPDLTEGTGQWRVCEIHLCHYVGGSLVVYKQDSGSGTRLGLALVSTPPPPPPQRYPVSSPLHPQHRYPHPPSLFVSLFLVHFCALSEESLKSFD